MVVGRTVKGAILLVCWVVGILVVTLGKKEFTALMVYARGAGPAPNWIILVPLVGMVVVWLIAMGDLSQAPKARARREARKLIARSHQKICRSSRRQDR